MCVLTTLALLVNETSTLCSLCTVVTGNLSSSKMAWALLLRANSDDRLRKDRFGHLEDEKTVAETGTYLLTLVHNLLKSIK